MIQNVCTQRYSYADGGFPVWIRTGHFNPIVHTHTPCRLSLALSTAGVAELSVHSYYQGRLIGQPSSRQNTEQTLKLLPPNMNFTKAPKIDTLLRIIS